MTDVVSPFGLSCAAIVQPLLLPQAAECDWQYSAVASGKPAMARPKLLPLMRRTRRRAACSAAREDRRELLEARRRHANLRATFDGLIRRQLPARQWLVEPHAPQPPRFPQAPIVKMKSSDNS